MSLEHLAEITIYDAESPVQSPTVGCCFFFFLAERRLP